MAILRAENIRDMSLEEMKEKRRELRAEYSKEQALLATGTAPENPGRIRALRRTIARLHTLIYQREEEERLNK
ncbi:MAG: 50S ribosomal protein L29 [Theionarchaea archaeon]|nr:50S ribosomal protein L29 [Theionarchaea archaeon]MBU7001780.1 50S ribosomal protein L29 [Theionarchaea archaeon]MBU7022271.1 50S ribosomal protein L29 [Theionarchaea archaeon]MBU7035505.1 50S ribosomal protein L29 [Theionarchaea archaeon]MBU7041148.1 50S ribosomal protein L29 [Theionarchaea archaeon]